MVTVNKQARCPCLPRLAQCMSSPLMLPCSGVDADVEPLLQHAERCLLPSRESPLLEVRRPVWHALLGDGPAVWPSSWQQWRLSWPSCAQSFATSCEALSICGTATVFVSSLFVLLGTACIGHCAYRCHRLSAISLRLRAMRGRTTYARRDAASSFESNAFSARFDSAMNHWAIKGKAC